MYLMSVPLADRHLRVLSFDVLSALAQASGPHLLAVTRSGTAHTCALTQNV